MAATAERLSDFLLWLRSQADLEAGDQQYLAAYELLEVLADSGRWPRDRSSWKTLIAPVLCSSAADQARFQTLFDSWFETTPESNPADLPQPRDESARPSVFSWERVIVAFAVLILGLSVWAWHRFGPHHAPGIGIDKIEITSSTSVPETPQIPKLLVEVKSSNGRAFPNAEVDYAGEQEFTDASGFASITVPSPRERRWLLVRHDKYSVWIQQVPEDTPHQISVQLSPILPRASGWGEKYLEYLRRLHFLFLLVPLVGLIAYLTWLRLRALELSKWTTPIEPRLRHIGLQQSSPVFRGSDIHKLAIGLRRRRAEHSSDIDAELTVESTAKMAGWFTPVRAKTGIEPEYLMLEERKNLRDHTPRSHDELISRLHDHDVAIRRYYFQSDPRVCSDSNNHTFSLGDLAAIHPSHELWLALDAEKCVDPLSGRPEKWVTHLANWNHRVLLSWTPPKIDLETRLTTPTRRGLESLLSDTPQDTQPSGPYPSLLREEPERWLERNPPSDAAQMRLLVQLLRHLGPRRYVCLQGCAVYPAIAWNITKTLVEQLLQPEEVEDALDLLIRLPWFRYGTMPDWLRSRLVSTLGPHEASVRNALKAYLETSSEQVRGREVLDIVPAGSASTKRLGRVDDYIYLSFVTRRRLENLSVGSPSRWRRLLLYSLAVRAATAIASAALLIAGLQFGSSWLTHRIRDRQFREAKPPARPQEPFVAEMLDIANGMGTNSSSSATESLREYSEIASDVLDKTNPLAPLLLGPITRDRVASIPGATIVQPSAAERGLIWVRANEVGLVADADPSFIWSANSSDPSPISSVSFFIKLSKLHLTQRGSAEPESMLASAAKCALGKQPYDCGAIANSLAASGHYQDAGEIFLALKDYVTAAAMFRRGCDDGIAIACSKLGDIYLKGLGLTRDELKAVSLYRKACNGGEPNGCSNLGQMYENGRGGVALNYAQAISFYRKACDGGEPYGCYSLGRMYENGMDVPEDRSQAMYFYRKACIGDSAFCRVYKQAISRFAPNPSGQPTVPQQSNTPVASTSEQAYVPQEVSVPQELPQIPVGGQRATLATNPQPADTRPNTTNASRAAKPAPAKVDSAPNPPSNLSARVDSAPDPPSNLSAKVVSNGSSDSLQVPSPDGKKIATVTRHDAGITIWDATTEREIGRLIGSSVILSVAWNPDGKELASGGYDGQILVWDVANRKVLNGLQAEPFPIEGLAWSPNGNFLASVNAAGAITVWDTVMREAIKTLVRKGVKSLTWSPDGRDLTMVDQTGQQLVYRQGTIVSAPKK
jgi:TPR repeat protein